MESSTDTEQEALPEGVEWIRSVNTVEELLALEAEWYNGDRAFESNEDSLTFTLYKEGVHPWGEPTPGDEVEIIYLDEKDTSPNASADFDISQKHLDFWNSFAPIHPKGCPCLECKLRFAPQLVTDEEKEEIDRVRKTVTVATKERLDPDTLAATDLYVGIGIARADVAKHFGNDWFVIEASVELASGVEAPRGANLMSMFRTGSLIGYDAAKGTFRVGSAGELITTGAVLPKETYLAQNPEHWLPLNRIDVNKVEETEKGRKKMAKEEKNGTTATATKTPKVKEKQPCSCGCGQETASKFAMGHDSKLRGMINRVLEGRAEDSTIPVIAGERCGLITVQRYNPNTQSLEDIQVPDCHFDHNRGPATLEAEQKKAAKAAADAQAKAEAAAAKAAEGEGADAGTTAE